MTQPVTRSDRPALRIAIDRGLDFLRASQLPSGAFPIECTMYYRRHPDTGNPVVVPDDTPFVTSHIAYSLSQSLSVGAADRDMLSRAVEFLRREQIGAGVWRYWSKSSPTHAFIPPDVDDTDCISYLLDRFGGAPENKRLLLLNRDRRGLFYTWLIPRAVLTADARYWWMMMRDLNVARVFAFWRRTQARRDDIDAVVNANVLLYLGRRPETEAVINYLQQIVRDEREDTCDKWYRDQYAFYYAVSRTYAQGISGLEEVREAARVRLAARACADGRIGEHELHTALAVCALANFRVASPVLDRAAAYLLRTQQDDGGWPTGPFYFGGPKRDVAWGSRALTTGFSVEALEHSGVPRASTV
jgi:hypothetical protein